MHHVALCEAPTATIICVNAVTFLGLVVAALGAGVTLGRLPCKHCTICRASLHGHVNLEVYTFERKVLLNSLPFMQLDDNCEKHIHSAHPCVNVLTLDSYKHAGDRGFIVRIT